MANIIFFMVPERGHINPSLKIAKRLKSRGHRVYYLQILEHEDYIRSQGLEFIPIFEKFLPKGHQFSRYYSTKENMLRHVKEAAAKSGLDFVSFLVREAREKLTGINPHLLLLDLYAVIDGVEAKLGIPYIFLNPTIASPFSGKGFAGNPAGAKIPTLVLCPEEFVFPPPERTALIHYVEASVDFQRTGSKFSWDRMREDKRIIYCSLGTQSHWSYGHTDHESSQRARKKFLQTVICAVAGLPDWQLVLSLGGYLSQKDFHSVSPDMLFINDNNSQIEILKKASLMITHGGLNSVKECILLGVPMIVFPLLGDQFKNAAAVAHHRLGVTGSIEDYSEERILSLILEVAGNPLYSLKLKEMKAVFQNAENEARSISIIEAALARQGLCCANIEPTLGQFM